MNLCVPLLRAREFSYWEHEHVAVETLSSVERNLALGLIVTLASSRLAANTYTWDAAGVGNLSTMDSGGTWNTSGLNWWNNTTDQAWNSATDTAVFGAAAGTNAYTVNVASGGVSVGGITFQSQAYTIAGNSITLAGATPTVTVNATSGTISSSLAGSSGLTVNGTGTAYPDGQQQLQRRNNGRGGILQIGNFGANEGNVVLPSSGSVTVASGGEINFAMTSEASRGIGNTIILAGRGRRAMAPSLSPALDQLCRPPTWPCRAGGKRDH